MRLIVVDGFSYAITDKSESTITATITLTGIPSIKNKVNGNGFCYDGFSVSVTNITAPGAGATTPDPGPYTANFIATALKVNGLDVNKFPLRVDDKTGIISATPVIPGGPTPFPVTFKIQITDAGQTTVQAN